VDGLQRWRYHGRRHQQRILAQHRTAAALIGTAAAALLLVLIVALWPAPKRGGVVLPEAPRATAPLTDPRASEGSGSDPSATPTASVPAPPPPPTQPEIPSSAPAPPPARPPAPAPPPRVNIPVSSFEAESAANTLIGPATIHTLAEASGGHTIGNIGKVNSKSPGALRVNGLNVPAAGTFTLTVFYISGDGDRAATIRVNGNLRTVTFPGTGDWNTIGSLTTRIDLNPGDNSVEFSNPVDPAPDIDRVTLGP